MNNVEQKSSEAIEVRQYDSIAGTLAFFGVVQIIAGIILFISLLPGEPEAGYVWLFTKYVPAITWLFTGIISGLFFLAIARMISYLRTLSVQLAFLQKVNIKPKMDIDDSNKVQ